jgi:hypothetical protein
VSYQPTYLFEAGGIGWLLTETPPGWGKAERRLERRDCSETVVAAWQAFDGWHAELIDESDRERLGADADDLQALMEHLDEHPPPASPSAEGVDHG